MSEKRIGIQLHSLREECARDLPGTLAKIARIGYSGVELHPGFDAPEAGEFKKMLGDTGLVCCGAHHRLGSLEGEQLKSKTGFSLEIGNKFIIVASPPEGTMGSLSSWEKLAGAINDLSGKLEPLGLQAGYHNHAVEFEPVEGRIPWEIVMDNTRPEVVMQIDTGNALRGGGKAEDYLEKYPGRAVTVHIKEYSASKDNVIVGEGDVNWQKVFELCEKKAGTQWYIIEQNFGPGVFEGAERSLARVRDMLK